MDQRGIVVEPANDQSRKPALWGMSRTLINNMLVGVKEGFEKKLEINGVGYRAAMQGKDLKLALGFSHDVVYRDAGGHHHRCAPPTEITS